VLENVEVGWDYRTVCYNCEYGIEDIKDNAEFPWEWEIVSRKKTISIKEIISHPEMAWVYREVGYRNDISNEHKEWLASKCIELVVEEEKPEHDSYITHRNIEPVRSSQIKIVKKRENQEFKRYVTNRLEYIKGMLNQVEGIMKEVYSPRRILKYDSNVEL
jgi:hypothetical protein